MAGLRNIQNAAGANVYLTNSSPEHIQNFLKNAHPLQKVNHFPASEELEDKEQFCANLNEMREKHPEEFNITPKSWVIPEELEEF